MILAVGGYRYSAALSLAEAMEGVTQPLLLAPPWGNTSIRRDGGPVSSFLLQLKDSNPRRMGIRCTRTRTDKGCEWSRYRLLRPLFLTCYTPDTLDLKLSDFRLSNLSATLLWRLRTSRSLFSGLTLSSAVWLLLDWRLHGLPAV